MAEFLKGVFKAKTCLRSFFEEVGVSSNFNKQAHEDRQYMRIRTSLPMEENTQSVFTPFAFRALQHELVLAMQYGTNEMPDGSSLVRHFKNMYGECLVTWKPESEQIQCSCKDFESSGILCRHALRVLVVKNYFQVPERYLLSRWRRNSWLD